jgi:NAD(P)-dependent dehydrogenase (short-subunit alcohol dehydrogenase family)
MAAKNLMDLTGCVAVVIGGTSGLGRELAIGLATAGPGRAGRRAFSGKNLAADERR